MEMTMTINGNESSRIPAEMGERDVAMARETPPPARRVDQSSGGASTSADDCVQRSVTSQSEHTQDEHEDKNDEAKSDAQRQQQTHHSEDDQLCVHVKFLHREHAVALRCARSISIAELKQRVRDAYEPPRHDGDGGAQPPSSAEVSSDRDTRGPLPSQTHESSTPLRLIYKGKVLKDDQALASYAFVSGDTIHAVFSRPSVSASHSSAVEGRDTTPTNEAVSRPETTPAAGGQDNGHLR
ncbi:hypothetical protein P43SY_010511 [Pythium insidiosum]|uniref:Ubiquitin-like domain-containing protein n=1 Tax=Pythium insidiosum TaxID=114742 RepID=A0AAD5L858_PYTIN|nr:hypothetical protein P43SY_010511 [Pythium insidiosum]